MLALHKAAQKRLISLLERLERFFSGVGFTLVLLGRVLRYFPKAYFRRKQVVEQMWVIGAQSFPLACFFLFLIGMGFALQTGIGMRHFGAEEYIGQLIALGMVREFGPWMTAFVLVARNGSSMAAEVGTMVVSEEIDALEVMSISPADYVLMPRVLAFILVGPVLTVLATCVGLLGGLLVSTVQFSVPPYLYFDRLLEGLKPPLVIYWGLFKAVIFCLLTAIIAGSFGLRTRGGALGVGQTSRNTVVYSLVLIVFLNFILTAFYQVIELLFSHKP